MKKMVKLILLILLSIPFFNVNAVSDDDVYYEVKSLYINVDIKNNGDALVKELITLKGTFNGYERDLLLGENAEKFNGEKKDYESSDIYIPTSFKNFKVGLIKAGSNPSFNTLTKTPEYFQSGTGKNGDTGIYSKTGIENGTRIKMYNETIDSVTSFYLEYTIENAIVKHVDIAEFYYTLVGDKFDDDIEKVVIKINAPTASESFKSFAHGPLYGNVSESNHKTSTITISDLSSNTPISVRVLFDANYVKVNEKKETNAYALNSILEIEENHKKEAERKLSRVLITKKSITISTYVYLVLLIGSIIFVYLKYDKEYNSSFKEKYTRNFLESYPIPTLEYLLNKNITQNSFNASVLNLIHKKKINVEKIEDGKVGKDDYLLTLADTSSLTDSEIKIITMLFSNEERNIKLSDIKKFAKETNKKGENSFLNNFNLWIKESTRDSEYYEFYEETKIPVILISVLGALGIALIILQVIFEVMLGSIAIEVIVLTLALIYFLVVKKRTKKGIEDYAKLKAFKRFLKDFGKFNDKDLPEVKLWDKYLVYATALGLSKKVSASMKLKFENFGSAYTGELGEVYLNYFIFNEINNGMNQSFKIAQTEVSKITGSSNFSKGGFGGGGGGGGRGF